MKNCFAKGLDTCLLALLCISCGAAEPAPASSLPKDKTPPVAVREPKGPSVPEREEPPSERAVRAQARAAKVTQLRQLAEAAQAARIKNPRGEESSRARLSEAKYRLMAGLLGNEAVGDDTLKLAADSSQDRQLSLQERFELAALGEMASRKGKKFANREAWLAKREEGARRLMVAYPTVPAAYTQLLAVAEADSGEQTGRIARELLDSAAPTQIKQAAHALLARSTLDGRAFADVIGDLPGGAVFVTKAQQQPVVFYTWRPESAASLERARQIASSLPKGFAAYGINVGPDIVAAMAAASAQALPGEQLAGGEGGGHPLTRRLGLTRPGFVIAVGHDGQLHNLSAERDIAAALGKLN